MKFTYETHYRSTRPDGRVVPSQAALMEQMRRRRPTLSTPKNPTREEVLAWQKKIREKATELLNMPPFTKQPAPRPTLHRTAGGLPHRTLGVLS